MSTKLSLVLVALLPLGGFADTYDIAHDLEEEAFWKSDPVLFVKRHAANGLEFTSDERTSAASRLDGGVSYAGLGVYETKVAFGEAGGIERIELILFATGGTEAYQTIGSEDGTRIRRRVRVEKSVTRAEFTHILKTARAQLSKDGAKAPAIEKAPSKSPEMHQASQTWPRTGLPTQAKLTWNYTQDGNDAETFHAGFVRLAVDGPARLASAAKDNKAGDKAKTAKSAHKISDNVIKDPRGDTYIDGVPMVDQGQKGYCAVAAAERVLRYYGVDVDEHEIAESAGTKADSGTSTLAMKKSVEAIGKRYRLATVVCYGDFEKDTNARIAGLGNEVKAYNKAAKKLKKPAITDDMYISRDGNFVVYSPSKVDEAMDAEVLKEMKVGGMQKSRYTRFLKDIHDQVNKGVPLFWGVKLGIYPEPGLPQTNGGHMRLIIGYNDKKKEILYTDTWGAGHELKRMPADWAWTISRCLMYMKSLAK